MALQIPVVNRIDVQEPASVGRMNVEVPNDRSTAIRTAAVEKATETFYKIVDHREEVSAKNAATDAKYEYLTKLSNELDQLRNLEGDPTEPYAKFANELQPKYRTELLNKYKDSSSRTRSYVEREMAEVDRLFTTKRQSAFNDQLDKYRTKQTNAQVHLRKQLNLEAAGDISAENPESFALIDQGIYELEKLHIDNGIFRGTVRESVNEKGEVYYEKDYVTQERIKKDVSDNLFDMVQVFRSTGRMAEADAILEKYKDRIDPINLKKLKTERPKVVSDLMATKLFGEVIDMEPSEALAYIREKTAEGVAKGDPVAIEARYKATTRYNSNRQHEQQAEIRQSKSVLEELWSIYQNEKENFPDRVTFEADPRVRQLMSKMHSKDSKSISGWFKVPTESDPEAVNRAWELAQSGELGNLQPAEFQTLINPMDRLHRSMFTNMYKQATVISDAQKNQQFKGMLKLLTDELTATINGKRPFIRKEFGKIPPREMEKLNQVRNQLFDEFINASADGPLTLEQRNKLTLDLVNRVRSGQAFVQPETRRFKGDLPPRNRQERQSPPEALPAEPSLEPVPGAAISTPQNPNVNPTAPGFMGTDKSKMEWRRLYQIALRREGALKGTEWPDTESPQGRKDFEAFIKQNSNRK